MEEHYKAAINDLRAKETWVLSDPDWADLLDSWALSFIRSDENKFTLEEWEALAYSDVAAAMNCIMSNVLKLDVRGLIDADIRVCIDDIRSLEEGERSRRTLTADSIHTSRMRYISNVERILDTFSASSIINVKNALDRVGGIIADETYNVEEES